ncbi:hypothetical protein SAMN04488070_0452 [Pseudidiomarina maritima]|uniref:DUF192 domain-containing protein n=1 Tax=Pseudidiomarina maritima TaxID=519453 RepID=A0A1I6GCA7_9GAMM|nr:DUF192 domain-containing protein [Pseudidiomarina maritima]SFR39707.1 hypothetical protein SAMN04488070_0452 [Pseudidiomarina maritima]
MKKALMLGALLIPMTLPMASAAAQTVELCIDEHPHRLQLEIADTFESRARGLMARENLAEHAGMWFKYTSERPANAGFWMYNTLIPLDIAYLDSDMKIVSIITMEPCLSIDPNRCPAYRPGVPYYGAIELNKGYFERFNIGLGRKFKQCQ